MLTETDIRESVTWTAAGLVMEARSTLNDRFFVIVRHVLRNSLIPVVTLVALGIPAVFAGAIVTEQIFRGRASASC